MELNIVTFIAASFFASIASQITSFIFWLIISVGFKKYKINSILEVRKVDELLIRKAYCTSFDYFFHHKSPGKGTHFLVNRFGIAIIAKGNPDPINYQRLDDLEYDIYCIGSIIDCFKTNNPKVGSDLIPINWFQYNPYRSVDVIPIKLPGIIKPMQKKIVEQIWNTYQSKNRASVIISGKVGSGKSSVAMYLYKYITSTTQGVCSAQIISGFQPTIKNAMFNFYTQYAAQGNPMVLMLDEFDISTTMAERENSVQHTDSTALAENKAVFLEFLDRVNMLENIIMIATTNKPLKSIPECYTRKGRFDLHFTFD
jgi:Cdc6-like AAA superfamily ATPase